MEVEGDAENAEYFFPGDRYLMPTSMWDSDCDDLEDDIDDSGDVEVGDDLRTGWPGWRG